MPLEDAPILDKETSREVQSLIFSKDFFNQADAMNWAANNGFKIDEITETADTTRIRQRDPNDFVDGSLHQLNVQQGITQVVGRLKVDTSVKETQNIEGVEIFSSGVWNGHTITDGDIDEMIRAFERTKEQVRPYLKLGHDDDQALLQRDGLPAAGWIDNLRRVGSKLIADFIDMPKKIRELVELKAYRKVSSEIFHNVTINGEVFSRMLGAVALLGSNTPGVMDLDDILSMYGITNYKGAELYKTKNKSRIIEFNITEEEMPKTENEINLERDLADAKKQLKALGEVKENYSLKEKELADKTRELEANAAKIEEYKKKEAEALEVAKEAKVEAFVTGLEKEKLSTPGMKDLVTSLIGPDKDEYTIGDKKLTSKEDVLKEALQLFKASFDVNLEEETDSGKSQDDSVEAKIEKYMTEHKVGYAVAFKACAGRKLKED